jgi:hypothetical protein
MQWATVKDIDDVEPLGEKDLECLSEVRDVLKKFNQLDRLGIALLHSHFDLGENEVLLERTSPSRRQLVLEPVPAGQTGANDVGTIWMLHDEDATTMAWCRSYCARGIIGHYPDHHRED